MDVISAVALLLAESDTITQVACNSAAYTRQIGIPSLSRISKSHVTGNTNLPSISSAVACDLRYGVGLC
ncbi:hypothetical protein PF005_g22224 [Phytophthora fragariae]|uniref:Uncharacterized protein n=1 Tax=Phytophthora fragariae TaxID=53985 RepID=A0A6A4BZP7_9STRA|nr:hypothetical protein PF003_g37067 [Phytophthora fragariae]KAE8926941.1 hypothetical protein PF009_g22877 [Phytophthora fragariae]KAE8977875.1 hypothetical protein PF011_g23477 [Phytophthora fragariae]KAE9076726.1 hypothetical protein PF010_g23793 [Phytophthora fragariae]KAE9082998.1 hypothetical protein PF007_g22082 [Phytophthora fragariae]